MTRIIQAAKVYNPEGGLAKTATEGALDAEQAVQNQLRQGSVNKGFAAGMEHLT